MRIGNAILMLLALAGTALAGPTVRIRSAASVTDATVTVADLADVTELSDAGAAAVVAELSEGSTVSIAARQVEQALRTAGVNLGQVQLVGSTVCRVQRTAADAESAEPSPDPVGGDETTPTLAEVGSAQTPEPRATVEATLDSHLRSLVAGQLGVQPDDVLMEYDGPTEDLAEEPLDGEVSIASTDSRTLGRRSWRMDRVVDGRTYRRYLRASVSIRRRLVVAAEDIPAGTVITASMVEVVEHVDDGRDELLFDDSLVIGQQARRLIRTGRPICADDLSRPVLVRRGQEIGVLFVRDALRVTARARALSEGREGESIQFERVGTETRQRFWAVVTGPGQATVSQGNP